MEGQTKNAVRIFRQGAGRGDRGAMLALTGCLLRGIGRGYDVQRTIVKGQNTLGIHVKIDAASSTIGRIMRFITGLSSRATLKLTASGENLDVEIFGGMWGDKVFAVIVCWYFLWPLLHTMIIGVFRQMALHDEV